MQNKTIQNVTINYSDHGSGVPLVLMHGFPFDSRMWSAQIDALSDRFRIIAVDLPAFGQSKFFEVFTIQTLADYVHGLLEETDALPCMLVGLSMGGYVALAFAKKYPNDLLGLSLIDTRAEADSAEGRENRNKMIELAKTTGAKGIADTMLNKLFCPKTFQNQPDVIETARRMIESQSPLTLQHALAAMRDREDQTKNLPSIAAPALILVGAEDEITPPAMSQAMQKLLPRAALSIIPDAGHMSPMEQPTLVNAKLRRFVEGIDR